MKKIDWTRVRKVLVVRLRSIGDTVLATPSLLALRRFLPDAQIDILLEDWVAPLIDGFEAVDNVIPIGPGNRSRVSVARWLKRQSYDIAFNFHGGTTATFFTAASRARHRVGYSEYQYSFLYNHLLSSSADFWRRSPTHSAEQQLALLGFLGVPVDDLPRSSLAIDKAAGQAVHERICHELECLDLTGRELALIHPAAAFHTKTWAAGNFAHVAEHLEQKGIASVAVAAKNEEGVLNDLRAVSKVPIVAVNDFSLKEITALAADARVFVGNDSGIAHIAAAVGTPSVVIYGSSNAHHWRPWTDAPNKVVQFQMPCQPCAGYTCTEFEEPMCIRNVEVATVMHAIEGILDASKKAGAVPALTDRMS